MSSKLESTYRRVHGYDWVSLPMIQPSNALSKRAISFAWWLTSSSKTVMARNSAEARRAIHQITNLCNMATVSLLWASSSFRCTYWRGRPIPYTKCLVFSLERVSIRHTWSNESYSGSWPVQDDMSSRFPWLVWYTPRGPSNKGCEICTQSIGDVKQAYLALCLNDHLLDQRLVTPQIQVVYVTQSHPRVT